MIDSIGETIVRVVGPLVPVYLSEAETESYPYAVYELQSTPRMTKDGVAGYDGVAGINIYGKDFDELQALSDEMVEGLVALNADQAWAVQVTSQSKSCTEGVWVLTTNLQINQLG